MDTRSAYLIRIQGRVEPRWLACFGDLSIAVTELPGMHPITTICTTATDQAALLGILNSLYDFGYPLLGVERLVSWSESLSISEQRSTEV